MMGDISPAGPGTGPADQLRASHEDRDRVIDVLRIAAGDGRLTAEELDERLEVAFSARTFGELAALTADLPASAQAVFPAVISPPAAPKDVARIDCRSGTTSRVGRWVVPRRLEVRVTSGTVTLDFTQAIVTYPALQLDADVRSGNLKIITRTGVSIDTENLVVRSGTVKVQSPWEGPVTLLISVSGRVGSGNITARPPRPPRRTFWQWLRRQPRPPALTTS